MKSAIVILICSMLSLATDVYAFSQSFSAEAVQTAPGMQPTHMKLHVSQR